MRTPTHSDAHGRRPLDWGWVLAALLLGVGAAAAAGAVASGRSGETATMAFAIVIVVMFGVPGAFLLWQSIGANRDTLARNRRRRVYPAEPWRGLPAWDGNRNAQVDRRFGTTVLELHSMPVRLGGVLAGTIRTSLTEPPSAGFELHASAQKATRVLGRQGQASQQTTVLWNVQRTVVATGTTGGMTIELAVVRA